MANSYEDSLNCDKENYIMLWEYIKCILPPLTEVVGPTMILISETHDFCERREYTFNVLPEYSIITLRQVTTKKSSKMQRYTKRNRRGGSSIPQSTKLEMNFADLGS